MNNATELPFLEAIRAGHLFFYDLEEDEVVHFRREIYEAAQRDREGIDIDLTEEEYADAEDAWEIAEDYEGRYQAMPSIPKATLGQWEQEFAQTNGQDWEEFYAVKFHDELDAWLDSFDEDENEAGDRSLH